ncbi:hypothetical protein ABZ922_38765 [Streptomyces shenzhenensis]|uniref:hypothetical protein n=1 Tax=Streptomyces shenzhenensis TaxID=943815 RepID=UPI0033F68D38
METQIHVLGEFDTGINCNDPAAKSGPAEQGIRPVPFILSDKAAESAACSPRQSIDDLIM